MEGFLVLETDLERRICSDLRWLQGADWGEPRPGHSEGKVSNHIAEVLGNIDRLNNSPVDREKLRLIALVHDTFKNEVDDSNPKEGANHHAVIARLFAEQYIDDPVILEIIELHDEAFNSWRSVASKKNKNWTKAEARATRLIERLGDNVELYVRFFYADSYTGSKEDDSVKWFDDFLTKSGFTFSIKFDAN